MIGQPTRKPMEYSRPSKPAAYTMAEMPRKEAADMKSPDMATPFWKPVMLPPAV